MFCRPYFSSAALMAASWRSTLGLSRASGNWDAGMSWGAQTRMSSSRVQVVMEIAAPVAEEACHTCDLCSGDAHRQAGTGQAGRGCRSASFAFVLEFAAVQIDGVQGMVAGQAGLGEQQDLTLVWLPSPHRPCIGARGILWLLVTQAAYRYCLVRL